MKVNYFTDIQLFFNTIPEYTNAICLILAQFLYSLLRKVQLLRYQQHFSSVPSAYLYC
jgi:hypothetical protein